MFSQKHKFIFTPQMDDMLREIYQVGAGKQAARHGLPTVARYARKVNFPEWRMYERATELGLRRPKNPNWSEQEIRLLEKNAHLSCQSIQTKLKKLGHHRSLLGIMTHLRHLRLRANSPFYSAKQLSICLGFYNSDPVSRWIRKGLIYPVYKETERIVQGDVAMFHESEIRRFILENQTLIDLRKVDQFWFFDVMFEGEGAPTVSDALREDEVLIVNEDAEF